MTSRWLADLQSDIAAGKVRVVSDAEHRAGWDKLHWEQRQHDLRVAQRLAIEYDTGQLLELISLVDRSQSPHKETVKRQYMMALEMKREQRASE